MRQVRVDDTTAYIALDRNPVTRRFLNGANPKSDEVLARELELGMRNPDINVLAIADSTTDAYVGCCGIFVDPKGSRAEIYVQLAEERCGKGTGRAVTEFLVRFARDRGWLPFGKVHPDNERSLRMLERMGWTCTGYVDNPGKWQNGHPIYEPSRDGSGGRDAAHLTANSGKQLS